MRSFPCPLPPSRSRGNATPDSRSNVPVKRPSGAAPPVRSSVERYKLILSIRRPDSIAETFPKAVAPPTPRVWGARQCPQHGASTMARLILVALGGLIFLAPAAGGRHGSGKPLSGSQRCSRPTSGPTVAERSRLVLLRLWEACRTSISSRPPTRHQRFPLEPFPPCRTRAASPSAADGNGSLHSSVAAPVGQRSEPRQSRQRRLRQFVGRRPGAVLQPGGRPPPLRRRLWRH